MSEYMTTQEVSEMLRTPAETVRYWHHVGKGPKSFKIGRRRLYAREDVESFVREVRGGTPRGEAAGVVDEMSFDVVGGKLQVTTRYDSGIVTRKDHDGPVSLSGVGLNGLTISVPYSPKN